MHVHHMPEHGHVKQEQFQQLSSPVSGGEQVPQRVGHVQTLLVMVLDALVEGAHTIPQGLHGRGERRCPLYTEQAITTLYAI